MSQRLWVSRNEGCNQCFGNVLVVFRMGRQIRGRWRVVVFRRKVWIASCRWLPLWTLANCCWESTPWFNWLRYSFRMGGFPTIVQSCHASGSLVASDSIHDIISLNICRPTSPSFVSCCCCCCWPLEVELWVYHCESRREVPMDVRVNVWREDVLVYVNSTYCSSLWVKQIMHIAKHVVMKSRMMNPSYYSLHLHHSHPSLNSTLVNFANFVPSRNHLHP